MEQETDSIQETVKVAGSHYVTSFTSLPVNPARKHERSCTPGCGAGRMVFIAAEYRHSAAEDHHITLCGMWVVTHFTHHSRCRKSRKKIDDELKA